MREIRTSGSMRGMQETGGNAPRLRPTLRQPSSPPQRCRDTERYQRSVSAPHERIVRFNFR